MEALQARHSTAEQLAAVYDRHSVTLQALTTCREQLAEANESLKAYRDSNGKDGKRKATSSPATGPSVRRQSKSAEGRLASKRLAK